MAPFHKSKAAIRAVFGGNRSGKTTAGGCEFLFHVTGAYPKWYPLEQRYSGPVKGRIIATDYGKGVGEVIIPFMDEWLDNSLVTRKWRNPQGIAVKYQMKNGSVFDILTHEQEVKQFEGWKGHIVWADEPPPRDRWVATLRGLVDFRGRAWLTLTPLSQPWLYDEIYTINAPDRIYVSTVDIRENTHLSSDAIKEFEASLNEEEKEARLHGRFMHLTGLIYKEFNPNIHIIEPFQIKPTWTRYMAIDAHDRKATAVVWLAVDNNDNHYVYDELKLADMDVEQMSHAIHAQEADMPAQVRIIDPHNDKENSIVMAGGFNIRTEFGKHGVYCQRGNSDPLGKNRVRQALRLKYSTLHKTEIPQLRIFRTCRNVIYEFQHYIWDEYRRLKEEFGQKDAVKKVNDDFMDCLKYIYNHNPRYIVAEEREGDEIRYEGTYTKYPTKLVSSQYHNLTENPQSKAGRF